MNEQATEQQRNIYAQVRQISFGEHEITEKHAAEYLFGQQLFSKALQKE